LNCQLGQLWLVLLFAAQKLVTVLSGGAAIDSVAVAVAVAVAVVVWAAVE
jgi:hypothetical protein